MPDDPGLRSSAEIRDYLRQQLNSALRKPEMHGGELALRMIFDHLAHVERREDHWSAAHEVWRAHGALTSTGVAEAFACVIPGPHQKNMASVYAEFARTQGWLQADRTLTPQEYRALTATIGTWTALNRTLTDVTAAFGPPSIVFGGNNPFFGKTLSYLTGAPEEPMISFHLWNGSDLETEPHWPPLHAEPVLLAVRVGKGDFGKSFTFTPEGRRRRPEAVRPPDDASDIQEL